MKIGYLCTHGHERLSAARRQMQREMDELARGHEAAVPKFEQPKRWGSTLTLRKRR